MNWLKSLFGSRDPQPKPPPPPPPAVEENVPAATWPQGDGLAEPIKDYPNAFRLPRMGGEERFDPALKHYARAFREDEPAFDDDDQRDRWHQAEAAALEHVLRAIAGSSWSERLVLRGSATMPLWFWAAARVPHDLDWVMADPGVASGSDQAKRMLDSIATLVTEAGTDAQVAPDQPRFDPAQVASDAIWTYERADGVRLTFGWTVPGLPPGKTQCDFVFGEPLWEPPQWHAFPGDNGADYRLRIVSPELSLAWKFIWLQEDWYPQAKDLYDAVLLAEFCTHLPEAVRKGVVATLGDEWGGIRDQRDIAPWWAGVWQRLEDVDWAAFVREYPHVDPDLAHWRARWEAASASLLVDATPAGSS